MKKIWIKKLIGRVSMLFSEGKVKNSVPVASPFSHH